jgi:integrase
MAGGIYKRGTIWWTWWTEPVKDPKTGKIRQKKRYASSQSEKRSEAVTLLSTKIHEARLQKPRLDLPDPTYEEVRDLWLASKPNLPKRQDGTAYFDGRTHLDMFFGGWQAKNIDTEDIIKLQQVLQSRGLRNGIDHAVVSLRTMLNYAVKRKRLHAYQRPDEFPMLRFERRAPREIEEDYFEPVCEHLPEPFRSGFMLAYHSGMRLSEIERLVWTQVDLKKRNLHFPSAKPKKNRIVWRRIRLLGGTDKMLLALSKNRSGELVFPGFADRTNRARAWRDAAVKSGLGSWRCRQCESDLKEMRCAEHGVLNERTAKYHGPLMRFTRTTFIRNATNRGVPLVRIMQTTGHSELPTHMGYNVADEKDLDLIEKLYDRKV